MIAKKTETEFGLEWIAVVVCLWSDGRRGREIGGAGGVAVRPLYPIVLCRAVMHRFEHFRPDKGTACYDSFEGDQGSQVGGA